MADVMDGVQEREQAERERHINNVRSRIAVPSRFSAKNATHQSQKPAALRFRAWLFA